MDINENARLKRVASMVNPEIDDPERGATFEEWSEIQLDFRYKLIELYNAVAKSRPETEIKSDVPSDFDRNINPTEYTGSITNTQYSTLLELNTGTTSATVLLEVSQCSAVDSDDIVPAYEYRVYDPSNEDRVLMSGSASNHKLDAMKEESAVIDQGYPRPAVTPLSQFVEDLESFKVFAEGAIEDMAAAADVTS